VNDDGKVIAYHRWDQGGARDDVVVVSNFRNASWKNYRIGLPRSGIWRVRFNSDWSGYSADFGNMPSPDLAAEPIPYDGMNWSAQVQIGPYSTVILSQD
jgi:1,4-alpha-glucan branching enzyme